MRYYTLVLCCLFLINCENTTTNSNTTEIKTSAIQQQEPNTPTYQEGKTLFLSNCASCHNNNMVADMTGPALYGVEDRWETKKDLIQFIQNPQDLINNNHPRAVEISALWPSEMTAFPHLDSVAIATILTYIQEKGVQAN